MKVPFRYSLFTVAAMDFIYRRAELTDIAELLHLEQQCFAQDRLSARQFRWMLCRANAWLLVAQAGTQLSGYVLVLFRRRTSLARVYSLAIAASARGQGLGRRLLSLAEDHARQRHCTALRLEVRTDNPVAIALYERHGYRCFARVESFYQDHTPALRYEKRLGADVSAISPDLLRCAVPAPGSLHHPRSG